MEIFYTFGFIKSPKTIKNYIPLKKNNINFIFFKKNFFFFSKKKFEHYISDNIFLVVIGSIFNKDELIKNYNKGYSKNYLINFYKKYGFEKMISLIDGDFQILVYEIRNNKIEFNNSKFGIFPCYYHSNKDELLVSSSLKFLDKIINKSELNLNYIQRFLGNHYRHIENRFDTFFKNIIKLQPSHYLYFLKQKKLSLKRWYKIKSDKKEYKNWQINELSQKLIHFISTSVKKRINKQKTFFSLSGGLDSSTLVSLYSKINNKKVYAATISYDDRTYDEIKDIKYFAKRFVKNWNIVKLNNYNIGDKIITSCKKADKPLITSTWFTDFFLKKAMNSRGFNFAVSGLGGDQLHAGEYDYFHYHFADLKKNNSPLLEKEINSWIKYHNHRIHKKNFIVESKFITKMINDSTFKNFSLDIQRNEKYLSVIKPELIKNQNTYSEDPFKSFLLNKSYNEIFFEMLPCCLPHDFDNSNMYGIKNIYPYLDSELVDFMFSIDNKYKIQNGVQKILLRESTKKIMHSSTNKRIKKTGWNSPTHIWFARQKDNVANDLINDRNSFIRDFIDIKKVKKIFLDHKKIVNKKKHKENHMMFLWQLVSLELWHRSLKDDIVLY